MRTTNYGSRPGGRVARANQKASILDRILRVATEGIMIVNNGVDIIFMKKRRESKNIKWAL